jgi:predicted MFS family arabinose efflux permease
VLKTSLSRPLMRLIVGHVCLHAAMAGMRLAAPLWALKEGHSAAAVGVLLALFALMQVFLALPAGRYVDANGLKKPVGFAIVLASAGALLATAWPHFAVLCIAALCTGGATGIASIALQRHVGRAAENPTQLKQVFSWLAIGPAVSNFLGPFTAGLLIDHAGFRAAFFLMALLPLAAWFWIRTAQELPPVEVKNEAPKRAWDLMRDPMFRRLIWVNWLLSSCWDVHTFVVPILGHERGYSASVIGTILGAFAIAAAAVRVLLPMLAHSLREWAVVTVAMVLTALLFAVYPLMPTALSMGVCSVFLGFTLGCVQPMIMSTLHQITPEDRHGEALGLRLMAINGSSVVMPMLFGVAGAVVGVAGLFWVVGVGVGAGALLAAKLKLN